MKLLMLNQEKVLLMTRLAMQAEDIQKRGAGINEYYRGDYVGFGMLKSAIVATILYGMLFGVYAIFNFNALLDTFYEGGVMSLFSRVILYYFLLLAVYLLISYIVYTLRYSRSRKEMRSYYNKLKKLDGFYKNGRG